MDPNLSYKFNSQEIDYLQKYTANTPLQQAICEFTFHRTYSRNKLDVNKNIIGKENRFEIVSRVVQGTFSLLKDLLSRRSIEVDNNIVNSWAYHKKSMRKKAIQFFKLIWEFKVTPPGRGFWAMGTVMVHSMKIGAALYNCTFVTTQDIERTKAEPFAYVMDMLMLGAGTGFDVKGANKIIVRTPQPAYFNQYCDYHLLVNQLKEYEKDSTFCFNGDKFINLEIDYVENVTAFHPNRILIHKIQDSREGWVNALRALLNSYIDEGYITIFDYSLIRKKGTYLKSFGGNASGPVPLCELLSAVRQLFNHKIDKEMDSILMIDIFNNIARCVVAGNVRRSSQICLFGLDDLDILEAKNYNNPKMDYRKYWGWCSNNSVSLKEPAPRQQIVQIAKMIRINGEPGVFMEFNVQENARMGDKSPDDADGGNPCLEIPLKGSEFGPKGYIDMGNRKRYPTNKINSGGGEVCNLSETYPCNFKLITDENGNYDFQEYYDALYFAVLYCKLVTTVNIHWIGTQNINNKNRRIGVSQTGIVQFYEMIGLNKPILKQFLRKAYDTVKQYDREISDLLGIPQSIRVTTVKPSGTVSTIADCSHGCHAHYSRYYIRRVRYSIENIDWTQAFKNAGYHVEPDIFQANSTMIVSFPVKTPDYITITRDNFSAEQQFKLVSLLQKNWTDNQVSNTIMFKDEDPIEDLLEKYQMKLKAISMLKLDDTFYQQKPFEKIDEETYLEMTKDLKFIDFHNGFSQIAKTEIEEDNYCSGDKCILKKQEPQQ